MPFTVTLLPKNISFEIAEDESILQAGLRFGEPFPYGCRSGNCGTCQGNVTKGKVYYPNHKSGHTKEIGGQVLFCQAYAKSNITIVPRKLSSLNTEQFPVRRFSCRIEKIEPLSVDVFRLYLKLPKTEYFQFYAGQYINIIFSNNICRPFSLANHPENSTLLELHIRCYQGGDFSKYILETLKEREFLCIEGPLGQFKLQPTSKRPIIMVVGGTGFAPVKSMLEILLPMNKDRTINLYWGVRKRVDLYLHDLVYQWAKDYSNFYYTPVLSDTDEQLWSGETGWVHEVVLAEHNTLCDFDIYTCGPSSLVKAVKEFFPRRGASSERIYTDSFSITGT